MTFKYYLHCLSTIKILIWTQNKLKEIYLYLLVFILLKILMSMFLVEYALLMTSSMKNKKKLLINFKVLKKEKLNIIVLYWTQLRKYFFNIQRVTQMLRISSFLYKNVLILITLIRITVKQIQINKKSI